MKHCAKFRENAVDQSIKLLIAIDEKVKIIRITVLVITPG
ncbi:hypothetical protein PITCH_A400023 [uncultured Desulfobacterium sp.]|uniref:Uncharacterized protein n=1 Tax=uncultured Desulfobacterium sp. TaxID=201089 RepID=A0A445MZR6_9BACT|nr:hypothetical protein PITCH_A400023 [uncultured Desulfobacterium sp.]